MAPQFRCPTCKRHLVPHWTEKENAVGLGGGAMEPIAWLVVLASGATGYFMEGWIFWAAVVLIPPLAAWAIYRGCMRRCRRFYCEPCDKIWRGDWLRARGIAAQVTRIS